MKETEKILTDIDFALMNFDSLQAFERSGQTLVTLDMNSHTVTYDLSSSRDCDELLNNLNYYHLSASYLKLQSLLGKVVKIYNQEKEN